MSNYTIFKHVSVGSPVYDDAPDCNTERLVGYDDVKHWYYVLSDKAIENGIDGLVDPENTRSFTPMIRDMSVEELKQLRDTINARLSMAAVAKSSEYLGMAITNAHHEFVKADQMPDEWDRP